ncbi:hypothetical protein PVAG01_05433 [Phlyctema vagabunda]|uniref:Uncharacterized protein n=1 Tax=Phlyctema vagabunda TaxID=108571 RepID=A0ABR4PK22_9HELO
MTKTPESPAPGDYVRLHITPLTPALLSSIVPPSILPAARNISYHSIETFPERAYGFLELPNSDAEKIKKKLNGAILKGTKVRIEAARPMKEAKIEEEKPPRARREAGESKKRKRHEEPLKGVDIGERNVKRGWTTPVAALGKAEREKKAFVKSKYTTGKECLFKTNLPPNIAANTKSAVKESKREKKGKTKPGRDAVIHEFSKTTKYATFLRSSVGGKKTKAVAEYVEGKGWVDEDGNIVEGDVKRIRKSTVPVEAVKPVEEDESSSSEEEAGDFEHSEIKIPAVAAIPREETPTSSSDSSEAESDSEESDAMDIDTPQIAKPVSPSSSSDEESSEDETSHAGPEITEQAVDIASSDSGSDSTSSGDESEAEAEAEAEPETAAMLANTTSRPESSSGLTIKIPAPEVIATEIHPLEALYKRKAPASETEETQPEAAAFSFFGADNASDVDEEEAEKRDHVPMPMTPFTQKDFEHRGLRSAAPTPDTAHASKRFIWPNENEDDEDDEDSSPIRESADRKEGKSAQDESDFQKWFWENRGDANRAWKKRRKVVAKEKRQRKNRKQGV